MTRTDVRMSPACCLRSESVLSRRIHTPPPARPVRTTDVPSQTARSPYTIPARFPPHAGRGCADGCAPSDRRKRNPHSWQNAVQTYLSLFRSHCGVMQEIETARLAIDPKLNFFIMPLAH